MISEQRCHQIRKDYIAREDKFCLFCNSRDVVGSVVVDPGDNEEERIKLCLPPESVACVGLCADCWDMEQEDVLDAIAFHVVPEEQRN